MINMPGGPEIFVIFLVALIVLGPKELPKAMRTVGNVMNEIRKVSSGFQAEMRAAMDSIVDTPAEEKPHSATMGPATAATDVIDVDVVDAGPVDSDPVTEVVARNDEEPAEPTEPPRPTIDPADRAAG